MVIEYHKVITLLSQYIWPMGRIGGLLLSAPMFSSNLIPKRIKVFILVGLAMVCAPFIPQTLSFEYFNGAYLGYMAQEVLFGLLMGVTLQFVFQVFVLGGQIVSMQAGLGFAVMVDPASKASVPLISQLYSMMLVLLFLTLNGHLALLDALMQSFRVIPVSTLQVENAMVWNVLTVSGWMFKESVLVAIPAIMSLLLVNMAFGIMTRVAPQLNIFSLGFPITLLMGIAIIRFGLPGLASHMEALIAQGLILIKGMVS